MKDVRFQFVDESGEKSRRLWNVLLSFLHPVKPESGGTVLQSTQAIHPGGLMRKGNVTKADERDPDPASCQAGNQFTGIRPHAA